MKKRIKHIIQKTFAIRQFQRMYRLLYRLSLKGMNYGAAATSPAFSGEKYLLKILKKRLPERPVIFDVGANTGQYASLVLSEIPSAQLYSFEPSLLAFSKLQKNLGNHENVQLFNLGLSDEEGVKMLFSAEGASVQSSFIGKNQSALAEEATVTTLDLFCAEHHLEHIDFLKIDVEGFELNVLRGAKTLLKEKKVDFIQFEFGNHQKLARHYLSDFHEILGGFTLYRVLQNGIEPLANSDFEELFLVTNYLAIANTKTNILI